MINLSILLDKSKKVQGIYKIILIPESLKEKIRERYKNLTDSHNLNYDLYSDNSDILILCSEKNNETLICSVTKDSTNIVFKC